MARIFWFHFLKPISISINWIAQDGLTYDLLGIIYSQGKNYTYLTTTNAPNKQRIFPKTKDDPKLPHSTAQLFGVSCVSYFICMINNFFSPFILKALKCSDLCDREQDDCARIYLKSALIWRVSINQGRVNMKIFFLLLHTCLHFTYESIFVFAWGKLPYSFRDFQNNTRMEFEVVHVWLPKAPVRLVCGCSVKPT